MDRSSYLHLARVVRQKLSGAVASLYHCARRRLPGYDDSWRTAPQAEHEDLGHPGAARPAPTAFFFERLLDQLDPQRPALESGCAQARIYAGRWLALRRIRCGLNSIQIEDRTGIEPPTLLLVEGGLADDTLAPPASWSKLGALLAGGRYPYPHVATVLDVALGRANTTRSYVMAQVGNDLRHCDRAPLSRWLWAARAARRLRRHRTGLALLGLIASALAFRRRRPSHHRQMPEEAGHPPMQTQRRHVPLRPRRRSTDKKRRPTVRGGDISTHHKHQIRFLSTVRGFTTKLSAALSIDFRPKLSHGDI